jgi:hypothetical protein
VAAKTGWLSLEKNRPHIDRNLFAIHPVTNSEDFNFQAREMHGHPLFRELWQMHGHLLFRELCWIRWANDRGFARRRSASEELELRSVLRCCHAVGSVTMEDTMCWEIDYKFFAEQKKAQQTRIEQERRAGVIRHLLNEANKQGEPSNIEGPAKETAPAK